MPEDREKKTKETLKKVGHRGSEAVSRKVPRIREENKEMEEARHGRAHEKGKGEMTVGEAGHLGGKKGGHKGGETVAKKAGSVYEENKEREAHRPETEEERERVSKLVGKLKEEHPKR